MKRITRATMLTVAVLGLASLTAPTTSNAQNRDATLGWDVAVKLQQTLTAEQKAQLLERPMRGPREVQRAGQRGNNQRADQRGNNQRAGQRGNNQRAESRELRQEVMRAGREVRQERNAEAMKATLGLSDAQITGLRDAMKLEPEARKEAMGKLGLSDAQLETIQLHRALGRQMTARRR